MKETTCPGIAGTRNATECNVAKRCKKASLGKRSSRPSVPNFGSPQAAARVGRIDRTSSPTRSGRTTRLRGGLR